MSIINFQISFYERCVKDTDSLIKQ